MRILDCTLRDGGYYNHWDFEEELYKSYLECVEKLPIDIIEIGYRNFPQNTYFGKFFYCPEFTLEQARELAPSKTIAIMLNERDNEPKGMKNLLGHVKPFIDMVRLAVDPARLDQAVLLAETIKEMGFQVGFNLMYMSQIVKDKSILDKLDIVNHCTDCFCLVDSFGGIYPQDVTDTVNKVKNIVTVPIGFHGHNNIEMALANALSAIKSGCDIVDCTMAGLGRGAGNLKTELLLSVLNARNGLQVNYNYLSNIVSKFTELQKRYGCGTSLPYMVSGANSLPQKEVMNWIGKNRYPIESIITALKNRKDKIEDNIELPIFSPQAPSALKKAIIIGGGESAIANLHAVSALIDKHPDTYCLIHSSTRNAGYYENIPVTQFYCLVGNEGHRMERVFSDLSSLEHQCILPPFPRKMGTYIPSAMSDKSFELQSIDFIPLHHDSPLTLAIQTALALQLKELYFIGFDGYNSGMTEAQYELSEENQTVFDYLCKCNVDKMEFLTPTRYKNIQQSSIYNYLI